MIHFRLLGSVDLRAEDGSELRSIIAQPKPMAMLAYLAAATPAGYKRREELLTVLWPELDPARGRRALSQALHVLRGELPDGAINSRGVEEIGLDESVVSSDVALFRRAIADQKWEAALDFYRGELLTGFLIHGSPEFDQWLERERSRLKVQAIDAAWHLSADSQKGGDHASAQRWARRAIELDPYSEEGIRRLLSLLDQSGNRAGAIRAYEEFRAKISRDLELEPSSETKALVHSLRSSTPARSVRSADSPEPEAPASASVAAPAVHKRRNRNRKLMLRLILVAAGIVAAIFIAKGRAPYSGAVQVPSANRIVIAEFESSPGDSALGRTVSEALRLDLSRSHLIKVVSDATARDALTLMRRDSMQRITAGVAREVAIRENAKAVLTGEVRRAGSAFSLSARLVSASDGDLLNGWRAVARDSTELLRAIDELSSSVRRDAGESMSAISASSPLLRVSTVSLSALRKHAMGLDAFYSEDYRRAVQLFREAVAEDSTFADAHLMLSTILQNSWTHPSEYVEAAINAYRFRDKLRDAERYNVIANYMWAVKGDIPAAVDAHANVASLDPGIVFWGRYAGLLIQLRRYREAELTMLRGLQWETNPFMYMYLANARFRQGKTDEAKRTLAFAAGKYPHSSLFASLRVEMTEATRNYRLADSLAHVLKGPNESPTLEAMTDLIAGKVDEARGHLADLRRAQRAGGGLNNEIQTTLLMARLELQSARDTARAIAVADEISSGSSWAAMYPRERPYPAVAHFYILAGRPSRAREIMAQYERNVPVEFRARDKWLVQRVRAMLSAEGGDRSAITAITETVRTDPAPVAALADLVWACVRLGAMNDAARAARAYLDETNPRRLEDDAFNLSRMKEIARG